jgi:hypothetical protein
MTQLTRVVELEELDDLIRASRTAYLAYVEGGEPQAIRVSGRHENGRWLVTLPPEVPPADGQRVVLLIDDGEYYFELRGVRIRGTLRRTGPGSAEVTAEKVTTWDYGSIRRRAS